MNRSAVLVMMCAWLLTGVAVAQSNAAKFFGAILTVPGGSRTKADNKVFIGMHPSSAELAKVNACATANFGFGGTDDGFAKCMQTKSSLTCNKGGYFAVADYEIQYRRHHQDMNAPYDNAAGIACGKNTQEAAITAVLESCEAARKKRGLPDVVVDPANTDHGCTVMFVASNDGTWSGSARDLTLLSMKWDHKYQYRIECWGSQRMARRYPAEPLLEVTYCGNISRNLP